MRCRVPFVVTAVLVLSALSGGAAGQLILPADGKPCFPGSAWISPDAAEAAAVDLNADGYPDMVLAQAVVRTLLNDGHGVFVHAHDSATVPEVHHIGAGDLDGDGLVDLVTGTESGIVVQPPYGITTLLGDGTGRLTLVGTQSAAWVRSLTLSDFDLDGTLDVAASHGGGGASLQLLKGLGDGSLAPPVLTPGQFSNGVDAGDWDQDGDPDVLTGFAVGVSILLGDGAGGFTAGPIAFNPGGSEVKLVDVDEQDGPDALCVSLNSLVLRRQTSQGGFAAPVSFPLASGSSGGGLLAVSSITTPGQASPLVTVAAGVDAISRFHAADGMLVADPVVEIPDGVASLALADFDGDDEADLLAGRPASAISAVATVLFGDGQVLQTSSPLALASIANLVANFAARDISGDGDPDLVTVDTAIGKLHVALGGPGESFGAWHGQPTALQAVDMALVDATSDGKLDVLTLCASGSPTLGLHPGDGAGGFGAQLLTPITAAALTFAVGDLNDDGQPDAVVLGEPGTLNKLEVWTGVGDGSFVAAGSSVLVFGHMASTGVSLGDFDLDGQLDAASALAGGGLPGGVALLSHGDGAGGLSPAALAVPLAVTQSLDLQGGIVSGDFDADGLDDLGLSCREGGSVALLTCDPSGGFHAPVLGGFADTDVYGLIAADVDEDGHLDLAHSTDLPASVAVVRGDGACGFLSTTAHPASHGDGTRVLAVADIDQDGLADLLQLSTSDKEIARLRRLGSADDPWSSIGGGIPSPQGQPRALGSGDPVPGGSVALDVDFAAPGAPTFLVAGAALLDQPFKGGHLVPQPQLLLPTGPADGSGSLSLAFVWPAGIPSGAELWLQVFIADASAVHGFAATGGLRLTVP